MALFKYFKRERRHDCLPDPHGPLNKQVPSSSIEEANKEVDICYKATNVEKKRSPYNFATPEQKAKIGKYAAENGTTNAIRHFSKELPNLKESTIRGWRSAYVLELKHRTKGDEDLRVDRLPQGKIGRPLMLGETLDQQVQAYLGMLRGSGGVVNTSIAIAAATGIVRKRDRSLLAENGGHIALTKHWAQYLLQRMGYVKRKSTTKVKVSVEDVEVLKEQFLLDIKAIVDLEDIPHDLILNWDQTAINYVPVSNWTMAKQGSKKVKIAGVDDKRQITVVLAGTLTGELLPLQLIYQGKTKQCLPRVKFPDDWLISFTPNHWCNEITMETYIRQVIAPFICKKRELLHLSSTHRALCIFDNFSAQCTSKILQLLDDNYIDVVFVPPNCTDQLQPLDLSFNKPVKDFMRGKFQEWYSNQVLQNYEDEPSGCAGMKPIQFPMSQMKPLGAQWLIELHQHMLTCPETIRNGFKAAGISNALVKLASSAK